MVFNYLRDTVFREKFDADVERNPVLFFSLPGWGDFCLTDFDPWFWGQLTLLILLQTIVNLACAALIYQVILPRPGTTTAFLIGYGLICPILLVLPFYCVNELDLRNGTLMMASAAGPALLFFRTFEAMYEIVPAFAEGSLGKYALYFCSTVQFDFDAETQEVRRVTLISLLRRAGHFLWLFVQTAVLCSILVPTGFQIIPMEERTWWNLFSWRNLANNYIMAFHTSLSLEVGAAGIALGISTLTGIETMDLNVNPLTTSSSPSDFWGNRWNRVVSSALKRGVFVPLRKQRFSRPVAAMATFIASGLLHEYILVVITHNNEAFDDVNVAGSQLAFFMWNGAVLGLEHFLRGNKFLGALSTNLPGPIRSFLVVLTVLPLAHKFTEVYVDTGFYRSFGSGFPKILKL